jgi:uncharacterized RDD family membrane protein YckC
LLTGIEREFAERQQLDESLALQASGWRDEVAHRVESYRCRRSRKRLAGEFSMRFDFDAPAPAASGGASASALAVAEAPLEPEPEPLPPVSIPLTPLPARPQPREVKIIQFPRSLIFPEFEEPDPNELAEPVLDKPRILDVPEDVGAETPPLAGIALQAEPEEEEEPLPPALELPLQVAPLRRRCAAALIDGLLVALASVLFAIITCEFVTDVVLTKPLLGLALLAPVLFWAVYNYLFLVHGGATPGMTLLQLRLSTFQGDRASWRVRRWRALVMVLSGASLGFGFLWALFDQDMLCWHDRMTRTYLTLEK